MNRKTSIKATLISALFILALAGFIIHTRFHPITADEDNFIPFFSGLFSIFIVTALFWFRNTVQYAYVINGFLVIIGTITMTHFSIIKFSGPLNFITFFMNTMFLNIITLWAKFFIGKALFDLELLRSEEDPLPQFNFIKYFRYPNMGWWIVHLIALSVVYALGNVFWK